MTTQLLVAIIAMTTALISYSIGVWGEKRAGTIRPLHLAAFWFGLICDTTGTETMRRIALESGGGGLNLHSALGALALLLMAVHAVWATLTYFKNNVQAMQTFHRFSLSVWSLWLVPFVSGLILANLRHA
ncbi:TIGR03987 family protein [Deinococcus cavernae]|uniref:TIGR03987 family protein n=1 Tax=Deinococcus cavernae TaxID=2320857 RepID=A0A418V544_9DEIO|nr:HsmA family protein [Deinococcus cavernae]RJF71167.1 TIGR03987 family protein [Deinococcus cavernae]